MSPKPLFKEVIRPPLWLIAFIYFMLFSLVLAIWAAFDNAAALNAFWIAVVIGLVAIYGATSSIIVNGTELRIKKAHIEKKYCGEISIIDKKEFAFLRTRGADPAAYLATTFWISKGIKLEVADSRDSTPYWLISTKKAQALKEALEA
jgi:hypothetical protein